jgi:hypothetical protein
LRVYVGLGDLFLLLPPPCLEELDVNNEQHEERDSDDGAILAVDGLHAQLLGAPLEVL